MGIFEIIEEITLTLALCNKHSCNRCPHESECLEVFGKAIASQEIVELAQQCKAFNKFARANRKE